MFLGLSITHEAAAVVVQVLVQVLVFAFLVVMGCTAIMVPILLYGFDLRHDGWRWQHAALFTSMVAGTDAVAVTAIVKGGQCQLTWLCCML